MVSESRRPFDTWSMEEKTQFLYTAMGTYVDRVMTIYRSRYNVYHIRHVVTFSEMGAIGAFPSEPERRYFSETSKDRARETVDNALVELITDMAFQRAEGDASRVCDIIRSYGEKSVYACTGRPTGTEIQDLRHLTRTIVAGKYIDEAYVEACYLVYRCSWILARDVDPGPLSYVLDRMRHGEDVERLVREGSWTPKSDAHVSRSGTKKTHTMLGASESNASRDITLVPHVSTGSLVQHAVFRASCVHHVKKSPHFASGHDVLPDYRPVHGGFGTGVTARIETIANNSDVSLRGESVALFVCTTLLEELSIAGGVFVARSTDDPAEFRAETCTLSFSDQDAVAEIPAFSRGNPFPVLFVDLEHSNTSHGDLFIEPACHGVVGASKLISWLSTLDIYTPSPLDLVMHPGLVKGRLYSLGLVPWVHSQSKKREPAGVSMGVFDFPSPYTDMGRYSDTWNACWNPDTEHTLIVVPFRHETGIVPRGVWIERNTQEWLASVEFKENHAVRHMRDFKLASVSPRNTVLMFHTSQNIMEGPIRCQYSGIAYVSGVPSTLSLCISRHLVPGEVPYPENEIFTERRDLHPYTFPQVQGTDSFVEIREKDAMSVLYSGDTCLGRIREQAEGGLCINVDSDGGATEVSQVVLNRKEVHTLPTGHQFIVCMMQSQKWKVGSSLRLPCMYFLLERKDVPWPRQSYLDLLWHERSYTAARLLKSRDMERVRNAVYSTPSDHIIATIDVFTFLEEGYDDLTQGLKMISELPPESSVKAIILEASLPDNEGKTDLTFIACVPNELSHSNVFITSKPVRARGQIRKDDRSLFAYMRHGRGRLVSPWRPVLCNVVSVSRSDRVVFECVGEAKDIMREHLETAIQKTSHEDSVRQFSNRWADVIRDAPRGSHIGYISRTQEGMHVVSKTSLPSTRAEFYVESKSGEECACLLIPLTIQGWERTSGSKGATVSLSAKELSPNGTVKSVVDIVLKDAPLVKHSVGGGDISHTFKTHPLVPTVLYYPGRKHTPVYSTALFVEKYIMASSYIASTGMPQTAPAEDEGNLCASGAARISPRPEKADAYSTEVSYPRAHPIPVLIMENTTHRFVIQTENEQVIRDLISTIYSEGGSGAAYGIIRVRKHFRAPAAHTDHEEQKCGFRGSISVVSQDCKYKIHGGRHSFNLHISSPQQVRINVMGRISGRTNRGPTPSQGFIAKLYAKESGASRAVYASTCYRVQLD